MHKIRRTRYSPAAVKMNKKITIRGTPYFGHIYYSVVVKSVLSFRTIVESVLSFPYVFVFQTKVLIWKLRMISKLSVSTLIE